MIRVLQQNVARAKETVRHLCRDFPADLANPHRGSLAQAILTSRAAIPPAAKKRLELLLGPYL